MAFELPDLPYDYDALAPYMSRETLEFHHDKHHQAYVTKGSELAAEAGMDGLPLEEIVKQSHGKNPGLFNNAGQHYNHIHFWKWMKPNGGGGESAIPGNVLDKINEDLGGYEAFRDEFIKQGVGQFGSGWVWLALDGPAGKLEVLNAPNGENPVVYGKTPILGCDVWEHSYYIDYRNARPKYLEAFVDNLVNWDYVGELFEAGPIKIAA